MEIVANAFNATYKGSEEIVEPIFSILCEYANSWSRKIYHSPYTSMIGPTMIGKSRLLKELARKTCVVYICLRPVKSSGYPPRSSLADTMIDPSKPITPDYYDQFLAAILRIVVEYFQQTKSENPFDEWAEYHSSTQSDFAAKVRLQLTQPNLQVDRTLWTAVQNLNKCPFFKDLPLKVLFAIDEARALLEHDEDATYFQMFRKALRQIPDSSGVFTVVVDTSSRISNDPSRVSFLNPSPPWAQIHNPQPNKLYDPLYKINTFDKMVDTTPPQNLQELGAPKRLVGYGIPYFSIYYSSLLEQYYESWAVDKLLKYAIRKLMCNNTELPPSEVNQYLALAFLGPTIGIDLTSSSVLSAELTASHAAHCTYLDPNNILHFSYYPSQPVYAAAINVYFRLHEHILVSCIERLVIILRQGLISTEDVGEVASRIILLCAMNKTPRKIDSQTRLLWWSFPVPVRVESFLETLTGRSGEELYDCLGPISVQNREKLLAGWMFWNHFQPSWNRPINRKFLLENLFRGVALQCDTEQAYGQVLSIYLPDPTQAVIKEDNMTICGVQVENRQEDDGKYPQAPTPTEANISIDQDNPYLVIDISFQSTENPRSTISNNPESTLTNEPGSTATTNELASKTSKEEGPKLREIDDINNSKQEHDRQAFLVLRGLGAFTFLSDRLRTALEKLLSTHSNFQSVHDEDELGVNFTNDLMGSVMYDSS